MKKIFFTLIVLYALALTNVCAQCQEHMKFMGIPLNGTINQFQALMSQQIRVLVSDVGHSRDHSPGRTLKSLFTTMNRPKLYIAQRL